ncbi:MAG: mechanosensitive ion channel domain-containing protein [Waterburya sp.]
MIDFHLVWHLELLVRVTLGFCAFVAIRLITRYLGLYCERLPDRNIIFKILIELGSDIRRFGRFFSLLIGASVPIAITFPALLGVLISLARSSIVFFLTTCAIVVIMVWKETEINSIRPYTSEKDRDFLLTMIPILAQIGKLLVYCVAFVAILDAFHIDIRPILGTSAIVLAIFGLASQSLLTDIISCFSLFIERLVKVGSIIEILDDSGNVTIAGTIIEIGFKYTRIETANQTIIAVSNRTLDRLRIIKR